jgi:hypothetical protein
MSLKCQNQSAEQCGPQLAWLASLPIAISSVLEFISSENDEISDDAKLHRSRFTPKSENANIPE